MDCLSVEYGLESHCLSLRCAQLECDGADGWERKEASSKVGVGWEKMPDEDRTGHACMAADCLVGFGCSSSPLV